MFATGAGIEYCLTTVVDDDDVLYILAAYHWINVGVEADTKSIMNPLKMIFDNFNKDEYVSTESNHFL